MLFRTFDISEALNHKHFSAILCSTVYKILTKRPRYAILENIKQTYRVCAKNIDKNSVEPDQIAPKEQFDLVLHGLIFTLQ